MTVTNCCAQNITPKTSSGQPYQSLTLTQNGMTWKNPSFDMKWKVTQKSKTTTSVNLATALSSLNKKILIIDLDPQGNATVSFGLKRALGEPSSYSVLTGQHPIEQAIQKTMLHHQKFDLQQL